MRQTFKNYQITFQIRSIIPVDLLKDGICKQLATPTVPLGFHLTPKEIATLQMEVLPNVASK